MTTLLRKHCHQSSWPVTLLMTQTAEFGYLNKARVTSLNLKPVPGQGQLMSTSQLLPVRLPLAKERCTAFLSYLIRLCSNWYLFHIPIDWKSTFSIVWSTSEVNENYLSQNVVRVKHASHSQQRSWSTQNIDPEGFPLTSIILHIHLFLKVAFPNKV